MFYNLYETKKINIFIDAKRLAGVKKNQSIFIFYYIQIILYTLNIFFNLKGIR